MSHSSSHKLLAFSASHLISSHLRNGDRIPLTDPRWQEVFRPSCGCYLAIIFTLLISYISSGLASASLGNRIKLYGSKECKVERVCREIISVLNSKKNPILVASQFMQCLRLFYAQVLPGLSASDNIQGVGRHRRHWLPVLTRPQVTMARNVCFLPVYRPRLSRSL